METKKSYALNADELLEKIFYYMNQLFEEREFSSALSILTELGRTLVNCDRASFWFWDRRANEYWTMAAVGAEKISIPQGSGIVGAAIETNETVIINEPYKDARFNPTVDKQTGYVTKSILCMPVMNAAGDVIGAYQAINKLDAEGLDDSFNESDVRRISMATVFCGKTLESYLLYNEALIDPLTGLKNRRGFYEFYNKRAIKSMETGPVSIVMCDIDHFKSVNDTYGHNGGDAVLTMVGDLLNSAVGIDDAAFRWGGEEFILLLTGKNMEQAGRLAEKIRKTVEGIVCDYETTPIQVTMSFGVDEMRPENSADENVKQADQNLYVAKENGRNQVVLSPRQRFTEDFPPGMRKEGAR